MGETVLEGVVRVLRESGLTDRPEEFDSDIHSWRCSHPDIYGRCDCFQELAEDLAALLAASLSDAGGRVEP